MEMNEMKKNHKGMFQNQNKNSTHKKQEKTRTSFQNFNFLGSLAMLVFFIVRPFSTATNVNERRVGISLRVFFFILFIIVEIIVRDYYYYYSVDMNMY